MLIAGVWHGATGMFVVRGLLHGVGLVVNKFFHRHVFVQIPPSPFAKPLAWLTTFGYVAPRGSSSVRPHPPRRSSCSTGSPPTAP